MAQPLEWGRNLGCDFAQKSCKDWMDARRLRHESIHPFCDKVKRDPLETECTDSRDSVALCNLMEYDHSLPVSRKAFVLKINLRFRHLDSAKRFFFFKG